MYERSSLHLSEWVERFRSATAKLHATMPSQTSRPLFQACQLVLRRFGEAERSSVIIVLVSVPVPVRVLGLPGFLRVFCKMDKTSMVSSSQLF